MSDYNYKPLGVNDIRILALHGGHFEDDINCTLITAFLPARPVYEALSYCWGTVISDKDIYVEGCPVQVTENLASALRHLRFQTGTRNIWVDAVCINQNDLRERMQQVSHMNVIYSRATRTVIYLGDLDSESSGALDSLVLFSQDRHLSDLPIWQDDARTILQVEKLQSIEPLMKYPWWERTWVVQEAALADEILLVCGNRSVSWDEVIMPFATTSIKHTSDCCRSSPANDLATKILAPALQVIIHHVELTRAKFRQNTMVDPLQLLRSNRDRKATDPRDKVYGFVGLMSSHNEFLEPDYSIPFEEAYARTIVQAITYTQDPSLISTYSLGLSLESTELPSWVPDWRVSHFKNNATLGHYRRHEPNGGYAAGEPIPCSFERDLNSNILSVNGFLFDEIVELDDCEGSEDWAVGNLDNLREKVIAWENRIAQKHKFSTYIGGGDWATAFVETIMAELINFLTDFSQRDGRSGLNLLLAYRQYELFRTTFLIPPLLPIPELDKSKTLPDKIPHLNDDSDGFVHTMLALGYRRFFITKEGYFGTAPAATQLGDTVHILGGAKIPLVLRKGSVMVGDREEVGYRLVGDAYVHGIMRGEACDGKKPVVRHLLC